MRKLGIPTAVDRVIQQAILLGAFTAVGRDVLGKQFRLSAVSVGPRRGRPSPELSGRGVHVGGRHGFGKVL